MEPTNLGPRLPTDCRIAVSAAGSVSSTKASRQLPAAVAPPPALRAAAFWNGSGTCAHSALGCTAAGSAPARGVDAPLLALLLVSQPLLELVSQSLLDAPPVSLPPPAPAPRRRSAAAGPPQRSCLVAAGCVRDVPREVRRNRGVTQPVAAVHPQRCAVVTERAGVVAGNPQCSADVAVRSRDFRMVGRQRLLLDLQRPPVLHQRTGVVAGIQKCIADVAVRSRDGRMAARQ
eukprot:gene1538-biopygen2639